MDQAFLDYYQLRLEVHSRLDDWAESRVLGALEAEIGIPHPQPIVKDAVRGALAAARETATLLQVDLRPDAELLLLLLAQEIVARPVATVTPDQATDLPEVLRADVETLVSNARESADDDEISAHAVVDSLSRSWDQLRSARFRIWDRSGGTPAQRSTFRPSEPGGELDLGPGEASAGAS